MGLIREERLLLRAKADLERAIRAGKDADTRAERERRLGAKDLMRAALMGLRHKKTIGLISANEYAARAFEVTQRYQEAVGEDVVSEWVSLGAVAERVNLSMDAVDELVKQSAELLGMTSANMRDNPRYFSAGGRLNADIARMIEQFAKGVKKKGRRKKGWSHPDQLSLIKA